MMRNGSGSSSTTGRTLTRFDSVLLREIKKSAGMILRDLRAPMPRFRLVTPHEDCSVLYDRDALLGLFGRRRRQWADCGAGMLSALGAFVESKGATHCIYATIADVPDLPRAIIAAVVDRQTGGSRCIGQQLFLHPTRLGPITEIPIEDVPEGPDVVGLLLRDRSLADAHARQAWEAVLDYGVIRIVPEEPWVSGSDRVPH